MDDLLSNVDAIILEGDPLDIYYVGGRVEKILGFPKEAWFEHPQGPVGFWSERLHPDDQDKVETCIRAIEAAEDHTFEYRMIDRNGKSVWFYDSVMVETRDGKPVQTRSVMIDIKDRKQAEEALRTSESQLNLITDNVPALMTYVDSDQRYRFVNRGYEELVDRPRTEIVGKHVRDVLGEENYLAYRNHIERALQGHRQSHEVPLGANGSPKKWMQVEYVPDLDDANQVRGYFALIRDITEHKQAEEALRKSEERLELAIRGTSDGLWDANLLTEQEYWSPRFKELLGYGEHELEATFENFQKMLHPDDAADVGGAIQRHLEESQPYDVEFRMRTKNGESRWFRSRGEAQKDENGKPYRMAGSIRDTTDRKLAEKKLRTTTDRMQVVLDALPVVTYMCRLDGDFGATYIGGDVFEITGFPAREFTENAAFWASRIHPDDASRVFEDLASVPESNS